MLTSLLRILMMILQREEFYEKFGDGATFPQVLLDGSNMGGCAETIEYLVSIGCLQEEKDMECTV